MGDVCVRQRDAGPKVAGPRPRVGPGGGPPATPACSPKAAAARTAKPAGDELKVSAECRKAIDFAAAGPGKDRNDLPPAPTSTPSSTPSAALSLAPSLAPSSAPSLAPSLAPSAAPRRAAEGLREADLAVRKDKIPVVSDDQLDSLLRGHEFLVYPQPGAGTGGIIGDFRVVGYAVDDAAWNQMGRPEGFKPVAYLRTHLEVGPVGGDLVIKSKTDKGEQKVSVDVRDITWKGQDIEKLAKDWALDFAKKNPGVAIPAAVVIVAGGVVGAYYYSKENGPIEFSVGSLRVFKYKGLEGSLKAKAQIDAEPLSAKLNGVEAKLKYDIPGDYGRVEAGARYNLTDDRWRLEAHYGVPLGKNGQGYLGAGAWAEEMPDRTGRDWEFGAGIYLGFRF